MTGNWYVARGALRSSYYLGIFTSLCYIVLDVSIAIRDVSQMGVMVLIIPAVWGIFCSVVGLRRLASCKSEVLLLQELEVG